MLNRCINKLRLITSSRGTHVSLIVLVAALVVVTTTNIAHAEVTPISIPGLTTLITDSLANLFYSLQTIASWLIYLAGALLNFSVNLTMHIKEFVNATPAVYTVWKAIRDISGMFIIFSLLYAAIMLIVSYEKPNYGTLIKNIVVAGVLINFSFFLTGLAIDVSNIVSLQLYNAIAPAQTLNGNLGAPTSTISEPFKRTFLSSYIEKSTADGGLSTIFMQSLGVTRLYNPDGSLSSTGNKVAQATQANANNAWATPVKIILIGVTSIIIMITAALSFFLASLAFIVRFVILIFLLAFSPILFASFVVPEIGKYATMWKTQLKNQLVFMPVYLLLMYFALSVLTSSSIFQNGYAGNLTTNGGFLSDLMVLAVNAVLVIVMLNAPLLGAMSMGAMVPKWASKVGADAIWKRVGSFTGRNTLGAAANRINESATMRRIYASEPNLGAMVSKGLSSVSGAGFGEKKGSYDAVLKQRKKDIEALYKRVGTDKNEERGRKYQESMRENLNKRSVFTLMMKDRANIESSTSLGKKADKETKKLAKKSAEKANNEIRAKIKGKIEEKERGKTLIESLKKERATAPITEREDYDNRIKEIEANEKKVDEEIKDYHEEIDKNNEQIKIGREIEEEERNEKIMGKLEALENKEDKGGGDKEKDKDKDKPKT